MPYRETFPAIGKGFSSAAVLSVAVHRLDDDPGAGSGLSIVVTDAIVIRAVTPGWLVRLPVHAQYCKRPNDGQQPDQTYLEDFLTAFRIVVAQDRPRRCNI